MSTAPGKTTSITPLSITTVSLSLSQKLALKTLLAAHLRIYVSLNLILRQLGGSWRKLVEDDIRILGEISIDTTVYPGRGLKHCEMHLKTPQNSLLSRSLSASPFSISHICRIRPIEKCVNSLDRSTRGLSQNMQPDLRTKHAP